ncbi:Inner centromere protein-related protein pic1 [Pseudocercospora fuligena]|uniref:Inner centromere protein-related protein pic1 n=1 Tax=Pseudocercospora fuligena TaxID=685502 RepID=A0A8H6VJ31_9PEZI|nr:Inner centromere protein-related protein pic1 [Pseudocercospora fuligena]
MAAAKSRTMPVGSSQWIQSERDQATDMIEQEVEEFSFSVRNELEWLNEHMADIFSKNEVNFADMFKTPGKLRGKTPRTARKGNALAPRQPLTDIFAPNAQAAPAPPSAQKNAFYEKVAQFQIPEDQENRVPLKAPVSRGTSPQRAGKPYTDSGYHGMMTEDEMELEMLTQTDTIATSSQFGEVQKVPLRDDQPPPQRIRDAKGDDTGASDDSFVSAKEQRTQEVETAPAADEEMADVPGDTQPWTQEEIALMEEVQDAKPGPESEDKAMDEAEAEAEKQPENDQEKDVDMDMEDASNHSDASSPEKPLNRKSSFTFSSLPAREPLTAKRSMGHMDAHRSSVFSKSIGAKHAEGQNEEQGGQAKAVDARAHSKTTAQMLHDRINLLGKSKEPRASKSIPSIALAAQTAYPQLPGSEQNEAAMDKTFEFPQKTPTPANAPVEDDDDDWIAPTKPAHALNEKASEATITQANQHLPSPARPTMHQKSISTTIMPSPTRDEMAPETRLQKTMSVSHPNLAEALESTTPMGSPARKGNDGPLSASKSRLWSALKSAKNIFASSASTSAAAKLEAHNNSPALSRSPTRDHGEEPQKLFNMPGAIWSKTDVLASPVRNNSVISFSPSRKTRHSNESEKKREKEMKAQEKAAAELEKAREKERQKAAKQQAEEKAKAEKAAKAEAAKAEKEERERQQAAAKAAAAEAERPATSDSDKVTDGEMPPPPPPKSGMMAAGKLRAPGRLMRPTKESAKAAPVNIRVASQAQRAAQGPTAQSSFSKSQYGDLASSTASNPAGPRAGSAQGHRPGTAGGNSRVKALEAAARKKEADEKAAQKKAEQKRELERKRAEKAEQEKRAEEERKAAEQQRLQEAKLAAQRKAAGKQAAEQRKREQERAEQQRREQERLEQRREQERVEQQRRDMERARQEEEARKAKEAHDLAEAIRREREQKMQAQPRGDLPGTLRQLTKNTVPAVNPAKPAKRQLPAEDDASQPQRPGILRGPPSYQQTDAKRRRTNEEQDDQPNQRNSVMAPPKRPSTLRKVHNIGQHQRLVADSNSEQETMSKFSGYTHAPPPAQHHASMFKATVTAQHQMQHKPTHPSQLVQTSNARIPFAESSNPPAPHHISSSSSHYDASKFKTPARPQQGHPKSAKTTPHYPQGDNIELPDIATDSEDEDSEDETSGFRAPSWTASPALRELLTQQQLVDPEAVFGPIPDLKMDEVFKNSKNQERLKRFRERGSSAMWVETGDAVTSAEKRRDMELRERVVREGGWRYEPHA